MLQVLEPLEIHGTQPSIEGRACEELIAVQHWREGELEDPASVIHLKFDGSWYRLHFDRGDIFWKPDSRAPAAYEVREMAAAYRLDDIAGDQDLRGKTLVSIESEGARNGARLTMTFDSGVKVRFANEDDRTSYAC